MLSNKWTFSLTSLVLILALALVVPSAMAGEFGVTLSIDSSLNISAESGNHVAYGADLEIQIATGGVVSSLLLPRLRVIRVRLLVTTLPRWHYRHLRSTIFRLSHTTILVV